MPRPPPVLGPNIAASAQPGRAQTIPSAASASPGIYRRAVPLPPRAAIVVATQGATSRAMPAPAAAPDRRDPRFRK